MAITPEPFVTAVVRDLVDVLATRHGPGWQGVLAAHKFTEYCLYWIYLMTKGACDRYYDVDTGPLYDHAVTSPAQVPQLAEHMTRAFDASGRHYFSFIQTSLEVSTEAIVACLPLDGA